MDEAIIRVGALCIALAGAETLHGIFRAAVLVPRIGKKRALKVSIVSGTLLAFVVCYLLVPGIGITESRALMLVGLVLALFMATFDIVLARTVLHLPWGKVLRDFDPRTGNYLAIGLLLLAFMPLVVMRLP